MWSHHRPPPVWWLWVALAPSLPLECPSIHQVEIPTRLNLYILDGEKWSDYSSVKSYGDWTARFLQSVCWCLQHGPNHNVSWRVGFLSSIPVQLPTWFTPIHCKAMFSKCRMHLASVAGNPASTGPVPSPAVGSKPDEVKYLQKLQQLQKYVEPVKRMIAKIEKEEGRWPCLHDCGLLPTVGAAAACD